MNAINIVTVTMLREEAKDVLDFLADADIADATAVEDLHNALHGLLNEDAD